MKTLIYEHKPERLTLYQVTTKDASDIAQAIGANRYVININLDQDTGLIEFMFKEGDVRSLLTNVNDYIGAKEDGRLLIFKTLEEVGEHYRKAKKTV